MKPEVDMSLVKEGLNVPAVYEDAGYIPLMEAALEKGLILEPEEYTYTDVTSIHDSTPIERTREVPDTYFYTLQAYYRKAFEVYLLQTLRLDLYDKEIEESGLDFRQVEHERMSKLERLSNVDLKHMYICVPLRIEQLEQEDADTLKRLYEENGSEITDEALELVERTYKRAVFVRAFDGSYDLQSGSGIHWNPESLVISFTMPAVFGEGNSFGEEEQAARRSREQFLLEKLPQYWKEMESLLEAPLTLAIEDSGGIYLFTVTDEIYHGANLYEPSQE